MHLLLLFVCALFVVPESESNDNPLQYACNEFRQRVQWQTYHIIAKGSITRYDNGKQSGIFPVLLEQIVDKPNASSLYLCDWPNVKSGSLVNGKFIPDEQSFSSDSGIIIEKNNETTIYVKLRNMVEVYPAGRKPKDKIRKIDLRLLGGFAGWNQLFNGLDSADTRFPWFEKEAAYKLRSSGTTIYYYPKENIPTSNCGEKDVIKYELDRSNSMISSYSYVFDYGTKNTVYDSCFCQCVKLGNNWIPNRISYSIAPVGSSTRLALNLEITWEINKPINASDFTENKIGQYYKGFSITDYRLGTPVLIDNPLSRSAYSIPIRPASSPWFSWPTYILIGLCLLAGILLTALLLKRRRILASKVDIRR